MILQELMDILKEYSPETPVMIAGDSPESLVNLFCPTPKDVIQSHLEFFDEDVDRMTINL